MKQELDNLHNLLKDNASVAKSLDILIDAGFFTYAYMLVSKEVLDPNYISDDKSEVLKGAHLCLASISAITENLIFKIQEN